MFHVISLCWRMGSPGTSWSVSARFHLVHNLKLTESSPSTFIYSSPVLVAFKLYDRDGNGVLDSSVSNI